MLICLCFFGRAIICAMKTTRLHASRSGGNTSPYWFAAILRSFALALALFAWVAIAPAVLAAGQQDLNSLEKHFFEHTYPQDTTEDRLTRLEKMVFGEARTGDDQTRLQQLINAVPAQQPGDNSQSSATSAQGGEPDGSQANAGGPQSAGQGDDDSDTTSGTDYPRVTELEKVLLGKTYQGEPIKHRLDQLELKSFGKTHSNEDLADRVDRIAQYADKKVNGSQNAAFYQSEPKNGSLEQKVAWLETQIEGQSFPQKPMIERLRPLEQAMFPTDPTDIHASIPEQVNMLMSAVELLHKQQTGQASGDQELNIAPLVQNPQQQQQTVQQPQSGYARHNNYGSDLQREFEDDNGSAPAPSYSSNYRPQQAYGQSQPTYAQSQGYGSQYAQQPAYSQPTQASNTAQKSHGHPFFRGLAKALGEVGSMVGTSMMQSSMYGGGYGGYGYGGYGVPGGAVFGFP